jgi:hypothetical protein
MSYFYDNRDEDATPGAFTVPNRWGTEYGSDAFKNLEICIERRILDLEPKDIEGGDQGLTFDGNEIFELAEDDIDDSLKETSSNCIDIGEGENENNGTTRA